MKSLWTYIEKKRWLAEKKYRVILLILGIAFGLAGFLLWMIVRLWALSTWDWMVCFIGYPVIFSLIFVFVYSANHRFHDGEYNKKGEEYSE